MESSIAEFALEAIQPFGHLPTHISKTSRICLDVAGFARILVAAWGDYDSKQVMQCRC